MYYKLFMWFLFITITEASRIGFDCETSPPNVTTYALLDSGKYDFHTPQTNSTNVQIQLLQLAEFKKSQTIHSKIKIHRPIYQYDIFGHLITMETAKQDYIYEISHESHLWN